MSKQKFEQYITNPKRKKKETYNPGTPNYIEQNIDPIKINFGKIPKTTIHYENTENLEPLSNNPRLKEKKFDIPQELINSVKIPNIGNNEERTWEKAYDIIDDLQEENEDHQVEEIKEYLLLYNNNIFFTGSYKEVEQMVQDILYNEHPDFIDVEVSINDLVVLKKLKIKAGIYLEE